MPRQMTQKESSPSGITREEPKVAPASQAIRMLNRLTGWPNFTLLQSRQLISGPDICCLTLNLSDSFLDFTSFLTEQRTVFRARGPALQTVTYVLNNGRVDDETQPCWLLRFSSRMFYLVMVPRRIRNGTEPVSGRLLSPPPLRRSPCFVLRQSYVVCKNAGITVPLMRNNQPQFRFHLRTTTRVAMGCGSMVVHRHRQIIQRRPGWEGDVWGGEGWACGQSGCGKWRTGRQSLGRRAQGGLDEVRGYHW